MPISPYLLQHVPGHLKMQEMCDKAVRNDPSSCNMFLIGLLQGREHICGMMTIMMIMVIIGLLGDDNDDKFFKWYNDYKKWKS